MLESLNVPSAIRYDAQNRSGLAPLSVARRAGHGTVAIVPENAVQPAATDQGQAVKGMFGRIAGRYDLLNRLLSARRDVAWRRRALADLRNEPGLLIDLACGTYDVGIEALARNKATQVLGLDFCVPMLIAGNPKRQQLPIAASAGDCMCLPLASGIARTVTISYGWRNVSDPTTALREIERILEPGGEVLILEFFRPTSWWPKVFYGSFCRWFFPLMGKLLAGDASAYHYLHDSVQRFLSIEEASELVRSIGFTEVRTLSFFGGVSHAILAQKVRA